MPRLIVFEPFNEEPSDELRRHHRCWTFIYNNIRMFDFVTSFLWSMRLQWRFNQAFIHSFIHDIMMYYDRQLLRCSAKFYTYVEYVADSKHTVTQMISISHFCLHPSFSCGAYLDNSQQNNCTWFFLTFKLVANFQLWCGCSICYFSWMTKLYTFT